MTKNNKFSGMKESKSTLNNFYAVESNSETRWNKIFSK